MSAHEYAGAAGSCLPKQPWWRGCGHAVSARARADVFAQWAHIRARWPITGPLLRSSQGALFRLRYVSSLCIRALCPAQLHPVRPSAGLYTRNCTGLDWGIGVVADGPRLRPGCKAHLSKQHAQCPDGRGRFLTASRATRAQPRRPRAHTHANPAPTLYPQLRSTHCSGALFAMPTSLADRLGERHRSDLIQVVHGDVRRATRSRRVFLGAAATLGPLLSNMAGGAQTRHGTS